MKKIFLIFLVIPLTMSVCKAQNFFGTNANYQTGTAILTSVNTVLTTLNASGITPKWQVKYTQGLAMVTGATQLAYGIYQTGLTWTSTSLNIVNITAGAATMVTNGILLYNTLRGKGSTTWNIQISPFDKHSPDYGFRIGKKFKI